MLFCTTLFSFGWKPPKSILGLDSGWNRSPIVLEIVYTHRLLLTRQGHSISFIAFAYGWVAGTGRLPVPTDLTTTEDWSAGTWEAVAVRGHGETVVHSIA